MRARKEFIGHTLKAAIIAVVVGLSGLSLPAYANVYQFNSLPGATLDGQAVAAHATFVTGTDSVTLTLTNLQANPVSIIQAISDIFFTASGLTSGTGFYTPAASYINIARNGSVSAASAPSPAGWQLTNSSGTYHLNVLCGAGCSGPAGLIIGPGPYTDANGSIGGNRPHNPFIDQTATFVLALTGATTDTVISNVIFSFGTQPGQNVPVPIPAAILLFASGLFSLIGIGRRKRVAIRNVAPAVPEN
jgi:hypothetical protein